jgi:membrane protein DedA with SNARE-associated domain
LGAGIWVVVLTWIGYIIGQERELIMRYSHQSLLIVILFCVLLAAGYIFYQRRKGRKQPHPATVDL